MRKIIGFLTFIILFIPVKTEATGHLQTIINKAKPYDTIDLKLETFTEQITINKPITLKGGIFHTTTSNSIITIQSDDVTLDGLAIIDDSSQEGSSIEGTGNSLSILNTAIQTKRIGISISDSRSVTLKNNVVIGQATHKGIQLFTSSQGEIKNNRTSLTEDGIYLEHCTDFTVTENEINKGRYGIHIMFGKNHNLRSNSLDKNITGLMVMATEQIAIQQNTVTNQIFDVNASGMTIFDVKTCEITHNVFKNNRYGIIFQESSQTTLRSNNFSQNIVAFQFLQSTNNTLTNNSFIGNVISGEAWKSQKNLVSKNYWDDAVTISWNKENISDTPYYFQSFYLRLQRLNEGYSLLFGQPGLKVLETLMPPSKDESLVDTKPLLSSQVSNSTKKSVPSWIHLVLIVVLSYLWYLGRRISL